MRKLIALTQPNGGTLLLFDEDISALFVNIGDFAPKAKTVVAMTGGQRYGVQETMKEIERLLEKRDHGRR